MKAKALRFAVQEDLFSRFRPCLRVSWGSELQETLRRGRKRLGPNDAEREIAQPYKASLQKTS